MSAINRAGLGVMLVAIMVMIGSGLGVEPGVLICVTGPPIDSVASFIFRGVGTAAGFVLFTYGKTE